MYSHTYQQLAPENSFIPFMVEDVLQLKPTLEKILLLNKKLIKKDSQDDKASIIDEECGKLLSNFEDLVYGFMPALDSQSQEELNGRFPEILDNCSQRSATCNLSRAVVHLFRNPLFTIAGYSNILRRGEDINKETASQVYEASQELDKIITTLVTIYDTSKRVH